MLMVTTTVRLGSSQQFLDPVEIQNSYMVDWIHSNAAGLGPRIAFDSKLVFSA